MPKRLILRVVFVLVLFIVIVIAVSIALWFREHSDNPATVVVMAVAAATGTAKFVRDVVGIIRDWREITKEAPERADAVSVGRDVRGDVVPGAKIVDEDRRGQQVETQYNIGRDYIVQPLSAPQSAESGDTPSGRPAAAAVAREEPTSGSAESGGADSAKLLLPRRPCCAARSRKYTVIGTMTAGEGRRPSS